jgi:hypothetical protein
MADQNKDSLFDKPKPSDVEIAGAKGMDTVYNELIGLASFMKKYKTLEERKKEMEEKRK